MVFPTFFFYIVFKAESDIATVLSETLLSRTLQWSGIKALNSLALYTSIPDFVSNPLVWSDCPHKLKLLTPLLSLLTDHSTSLLLLFGFAYYLVPWKGVLPNKYMRSSFPICLFTNEFPIWSRDHGDLLFPYLARHLQLKEAHDRMSCRTSLLEAACLSACLFFKERSWEYFVSILSKTTEINRDYLDRQKSSDHWP